MSNDRNSSKCDVESTKCENTVGSFKCFCKIGFESVDGSSSACRGLKLFKKFYFILSLNHENNLIYSII